MRRAKKYRKIKLILLGAIVIAVVIAIIASIVNLVKNKKTENQNNPSTETEQTRVYQLSDTTYNGLEVTNIQLKYLALNGQTEVKMTIKNSTNEEFNSQFVRIYCYDSNDVELTVTACMLPDMTIDEEVNISSVISGDFTSIKRVELK